MAPRVEGRFASDPPTSVSPPFEAVLPRQRAAYRPPTMADVRAGAAQARFTVVSTFAGCGGSSTGYKLAGGRVLLANEWDENAVATYRANYPETPVVAGDIAQLSVEQVLAETGLRPGELDIFDGSPPCQGFSTSGKRRLNDTRNFLFAEYVRLLRGLRPRAFVMENVSGMVKGKMKVIFADILRELKASGYRVACRLLDAQFYGVPQHRERVIFVGVREDLGVEPSHPAPASAPISCVEALDGLDVEAQPELPWLRRAVEGNSAFDLWDKIAVDRAGSDVLGKNWGFGCIKVHPMKPCRTISRTDSNIRLYGLMHWSEKRRFTVGEYARFASFPDDFEWVASTDRKSRGLIICPGIDEIPLAAYRWSSAVARMGNSVPPLFMRAVASHIRDVILGA